MKPDDLKLDLPERDGQFVQDLAVRASGLGRQAAGIHGLLEDLDKLSGTQLAAFEDLGARIDGMERGNLDIRRRADKVMQSSKNASASISSALQRTRVLADASLQTEQGVRSVAAALGSVAAAAADIESIAMQTRLVAFNATVEAARAGAAGRGFGVVAQAVKDLAESVRGTSLTISNTIKSLSQQVDALSGSASKVSARQASLAIEAAETATHDAFGILGTEVEAMTVQAAAGAQVCGEVANTVRTLAGDVQSGAQQIRSAATDAKALLEVSESLIEASVLSGFETEDSPFIQALLAARNRIEERFAEGIEAGEVSLEALLDREYALIPGSEPAQFQTRGLRYLDANLPAIQEPMLELSPKVVFCAAVDGTGYLPTHNRKFSQPQGRDPVWNAANCRNRRIFDDRTGLAAATNRKPFLLQTYRRDMGGGRFVLMKDLSAPIYIKGAHWGALRLAYRFD
jgi:methyl-accepting chemotaxis protein